MASLVGEHAAGTMRARLSELVARTPGRAEFALRLALLCVLTTWMTQIYETPDAALSTYIVFFLNKPDRTGSVLTSVVLTVLISMLIGLLLLIAHAALDFPPLRVAIMAALSMLLLFLGSASKLKPLASTIALILAYALDLLGKIPEGELATRALLYVWVLVGIPAGLSIVVNLLIGPAPRRLAERAMAWRLRAAQACLATSNPTTRQRLATLRRQGSTTVQEHLHLALVEKTSPRTDVLALQQAARSTDTLLMLAEVMDGVRDLPESWRQSAAATLGKMADILDRHSYPLDIEELRAPDVALSAATASLVADFNAVLATFAVAPPPPKEAPAKAKSGFFVPDAFTHPAHVRYAIKVTIAAMSCYLFYSLTDWQGIHTCLITCYIVALDTTAETVEKLSLRIVGALVGAAIGLAAIVWLTPAIDRIGGLLALVSVGALAGSWIAAGSPRIAYAGFQLSFAFFLCVIQGSSPGFDLTVARDRVIGILIGNAAIYLIFVSVWPVSIARRIDPAISALLRQFVRVARLAQHAERRDALPATPAAFAKIDTDLQIAYYEPASIRPRAEWFKRRETLLGNLSGSESTLLLCDDNNAREAMAVRFDHLADAIDRGEWPVSLTDSGAESSAQWEQNLAR